MAVASERGFSIFVCACLQIMELNQKLTKACQEHARYRVFTCRKNTYETTWGVKEGGGRLLKVGIFSGTYGTVHVILNLQSIDIRYVYVSSMAHFCVFH